MKFFTPELYLRFNSRDVDEAERADGEWDEAEAAYKEQVTAIRDSLPSEVVQLSELCLHDALVLSREERVQSVGPLGFLPLDFPPFPMPSPWTAVAIVSVTQCDEIVSLIYSLSDHVRRIDSPPNWHLSKEQEQWLYDEVDRRSDPAGPFVHRILFSSGVSWEIRFNTVVIHRFRAPKLQPGSRQIA